MKEALGFTLLIAADAYGLFAIITRRPAWEMDYWLVIAAIITGFILTR